MRSHKAIHCLPGIPEIVSRLPMVAARGLRRSVFLPAHSDAIGPTVQRIGHRSACYASHPTPRINH